ncbi:hypothetical protein AVEN_217118-1 [Araneus ventricosus]|uniref:Uncharacterized protein n=1 Tax=Araneus ventricosus TaxID=182803 RepID=A0A4Y2E721_ARAVE|nr:hypothetical protein AVEN_217118-1 [Araneus ventricosus]
MSGQKKSKSREKQEIRLTSRVSESERESCLVAFFRNESDTEFSEYQFPQRIVIRLLFRGRGGLVVRSRPWGRRVPGSRPDSTEDPPCMGPVAR